LSELGFQQEEPTVVHEDSASMIALAEAFNGNHKRVKYYMVRINFLIEQVKNKVIKMKHVSSEANVADILTKPLGPCDFIRLRELFLGN
jgi:hypothetical protein